MLVTGSDVFMGDFSILGIAVIIMFLSIGADLAGAVGANAPKGKGSVGACTQRKKLTYLLFIRCIFLNLILIVLCTVD